MAAFRSPAGRNRSAAVAARTITNTTIIVCLLHGLIIAVGNVAGQLPDNSPAHPPTIIASSSCVSKTTCGECLRTRGCAWCSQPNFGDKPRCFAASAAANVRCDAVVNPLNEMMLVENRKLTKESSGSAAAGGYAEGSSSAFEHHSASSSSGYSESSSSGSSSSSGYSKSVVQISPQRVNLKLRISK